MMKKRTSCVIAAGCLIALSLTACQSKKSEAETAWKAAKSSDLVEYVEQNESKVDMDKLKDEAGSADSTLSRQFKATALLCAAEYEKSLNSASAETTAAGTAGAGAAQSSSKVSADDLYQFDYPISASYADQFLSKVNTDGDQFWEALKEAAYPYDSFDLLFAASDSLDGNTLVNLLKNVPSDSSYAANWKSAIDKWVEKRPINVIQVGDSLTEAGYYDDWEWKQYKDTYFRSYTGKTPITAKNADEAIQYASYAKSTMLPFAETKFGKDEIQKWLNQPSKLTEGGNYLQTGLTVNVDEPLTLKKEGDNTQPDTIDIEGKKAAAFYNNTESEKFKDSPPPLMLLGDFAMNLSEEEIPGSAQDADYYLVLTPSYQYGDYYQTQSGNATKVKEVYSSTSIDLYDAKTGDLLRHLGNVMEEPDSQIFQDLSKESAAYPDIFSGEKLAFIYHNINSPDAYNNMLDHTSGQSGDLAAGDTVTLGDWEVTFTSNTIVKSFEEGLFSYEASAGSQFVRANFTIKNIGNGKASFFPSMGLAADTIGVRITDSRHKDSYLCSPAPNDSKCLNDDYLDPGESKDGELLFEVPDQVLQSSEPLYFEVSLRNQKVYYPLSK